MPAFLLLPTDTPADRPAHVPAILATTPPVRSGAGASSRWHHPGRRALGLLALCAAVWAAPAAAESLAASSASSASSAGSASVGSLSDSVKGSSRSASPEGRQAVGDWRVIDLAAVPDRPGIVALRLRRETAGDAAQLPIPGTPGGTADAAAVANATSAAEAEDELRLLVPAQALATQPLAVGDRVVARARSYGLWFAQRASDGADRPFFLALRADWQGELGSRAL